MKTIFTLFIFALTISITANAQWTPVADFPGPALDGAFSFTIGDKAYVGGGPGVELFYEYNSQTDTWKKLANVGGGPRGWAFSFVIDGKAYVGGGDPTGSFQPVNDFWEYNPVTNTWTKKADFGGGNRDGCFSFSYNGKGYVGGGFDGNNMLSDFWEYDPTANTWTSKSGFPGSPVVFPSVFQISEKVYVGCGAGNFEYNTLYMFNGCTKTWTSKTNFSGYSRQAGIGFAVNGKGYIGLGMSGYTSSYKDIFEYNPDTDNWQLLANAQYPIDNSAWSTCFVIGNDVFIGTGASLPALQFTNKFYKRTFLPTKVVEENNDGSMIISPNPADDLINISNFNSAHFEIFSIEGIKMLESNIYGNVDISTFPSGVYIIKSGNNFLKFMKI
ncbi:MAG: kelch repeat-containing protein [Bacteroidota bacterium]